MIHSFVDGNLGNLHVLVIVNNTSMNMRVQMYSASNFISFDVHADLKLLDHIVLQKPLLEKPLTTLGALENSGLLRRRAQRS